MTKRFKILDQALKYLETGAEGANPIAPNGTHLREYQEWKSGERNISYNRTEDSLPEQLLSGLINPFGLTYDAGQKITVPVSKRVNDNNTITALFDEAGLDVTEDVLGVDLTGFIPAKATVSIRATDRDRATETSQITGVKYAKRGFRSYTFPYGAKTATSKEAEVRGAIKAALGDTFTGNVSFTSERL